jgi:hypothetical protein
MWFITDWEMGARYEFSLGNEIQTYYLVRAEETVSKLALSGLTALLLFVVSFLGLRPRLI